MSDINKNLTAAELENAGIGSDRYTGYAKELSKLKIGRVVWDKKNTGMLGHIKGFARACTSNGYIININVLWDNGQTYQVHPNNVILL